VSPGTARPRREEAAPYYFRYIDLVPEHGALVELENQQHTATEFLRTISEERSLYRYAPGKWSLREAWAHVSDTERVFQYRAFWFARGFDTPLPSFEQDASASLAAADSRPWADHIAEFEAVRASSLALFRGLPAEAWTRGGQASGNPVTVRAIAYIAAGHALHHLTVLREKYLS